MELQTVNEFILTAEKKQLIKDTICPGLTESELELFAYQCKRTQLDPLLKQIVPIKRWNSVAQKEVMTIQTSIDGFRVIAERTGKYQGQTKVEWCGSDGVWKDVWVSDENPVAAKVGIYKEKFVEPLYAVAHFKEYAAYNSQGKLNYIWLTKGILMIAKCAKALALREAFPQDLSGLYTFEEMSKHDNYNDSLVYVEENFSNASIDNISSPIMNKKYRELVGLMKKNEIDDRYSETWAKAANVKHLWELSQEQLDKCIEWVNNKIINNISNTEEIKKEE